MKYAPVIIPTLNRFDHFKRCLESLEACTGAEFTDVYVALDYPPSEKYVEGWKKNNEYLKMKELNNGFNSLVVYRRKENYFFSGKGNAETAINDLPPTIESYIFTEDDNVFSPNFLDYINKGLALYKYDMNVFAITGYSLFNHNKGINTAGYTVYKNSSFFSAWGYAIWVNKYCKGENLHYSKYAFRSKRVFERVIRIPDSFRYMMLALKAGVNRPETDCYLTLRCRIYDMYTISPIVSLVKNIGWDGSGVHCKSDEHSGRYSNIITDKSNTFDYVMAPDYISCQISDTITNDYTNGDEIKIWMKILYRFIKIIGYNNYICLITKIKSLQNPRIF